MSKVALGPDIQRWLVQGMEHVVSQAPAGLDVPEMYAFLRMLREAQLVILVMPDKEGIPA